MSPGFNRWTYVKLALSAPRSLVCSSMGFMASFILVLWQEANQIKASHQLLKVHFEGRQVPLWGERQVPTLPRRCLNPGSPLGIAIFTHWSANLGDQAYLRVTVTAFPCGRSMFSPQATSPSVLLCRKHCRLRETCEGRQNS